jgi:hypothetical protein
MRDAINPTGRMGAIVPTGIATDDTTKLFFRDLSAKQSIASLYDFRNAGFFPEVAGAQGNRFCLLTLSRSPLDQSAVFAFRLTEVDQAHDYERTFTLTAEEIELLNPNTRTCPVFRSRRDAELTKAIYRRVPVLIREGVADGNLWGITFKQGLFNMTADSHLFRTREQLEANDAVLDGNVFTSADQRWLPLYEGKMIHHFHHRFGDYMLAPATDRAVRQIPEASEVALSNPRYEPHGRYWVPEIDAHSKLEPWPAGWLLGWRRSAASVDERTFIATVMPLTGVGDSLFLMLPDPDVGVCLLSIMTSFVFDYVCRQKLGGVNVSYFVVEQLPVPSPALLETRQPWSGEQSVREWVTPRCVELTYTALMLDRFAVDLGYDGPPFRWNADRRALLRAELDAAMFRLYGIEWDDVDYIMETFPIVRRKDEQRFGEYRTKRLILERYDALVASNASSVPYETPLDPPPGDARVAHRAAETSSVS